MAMKIPVSDIIVKISKETGMSESDVKKKIEDKVSELSDYITEEGAAHIIANELGVKLFETMSSGEQSVDKLLAGMRGIEINLRVAVVYDVVNFKRKDGTESKVRSMFAADKTGRTRITAWGDKADLLNDLSQGDTIKIYEGYTRLNNGRIEIHLGDGAVIEKNPSGIDLSDVDISKPEGRPKATRVKIADLKAPMENIELSGFMVSSFEPRFYEVDPNTNKRVRPRGDKFYDDDGNEVTPAYSCVMNGILDDGTENIRCVFFKNQMLNLCGIGEGDLQNLRENPQTFDDVKRQFLGKPVKLVGRVVRNDMFDRTEFVAQLVMDANVEEEMALLEKED